VRHVRELVNRCLDPTMSQFWCFDSAVGRVGILEDEDGGEDGDEDV
jgi:hypothetical protein